MYELYLPPKDDMHPKCAALHRNAEDVFSSNLVFSRIEMRQNLVIRAGVRVGELSGAVCHYHQSWSIISGRAASYASKYSAFDETAGLCATQFGNDGVTVVRELCAMVSSPPHKHD